MLSSAYSPDFAGVVNISVEPLSDDPDTAVAQTINRMADYVRADALSPIIRDLAAFIVKDCNTEQECARRIFQWMKAHVIFYRDSDTAARAGLDSPLTTEVLIRPVDLVRMPQPKGDCDCQSMTVAALLRACGIDSSFVTVAADRKQPRVYSHVYVRARFSDGDSMPLDASHGYYPDWEVENFLGKRREWSVDNPMYLSLNGLGDAANVDMLQLSDGSMVDLTAGSDPTGGAYSGTIDTSNSDGSSIDWGSILTSSVKTGLNILQTQFSVPNIPKGSYLVKTPTGYVVSNNVPGAAPGTLPGGFGVPSNLGSMLPWIVGGVVIVGLAMAFKGGR